MSDYAVFSRADSLDAPVLVVSGEVDMVTAPKFRAQLREVLGVATEQAFLDLSAVSFFDSTGISVLIHAQDNADAQGVDLIVDPSQCVRSIIDVVALGDRFHWADVAGTRPSDALKSA